MAHMTVRLHVAVWILHVCAVAPAAQQLLDRVLARVGAAAITLTDVRAAVELGLVEAAPGELEGAALERVIDRQLILNEVARFQPPDPAPIDVETEVAAMKAHAGGRLEALMRETGLDQERLRELARDTLRIRAYLRQRFGASAQPNSDDVRRWVDDLRQRAEISRTVSRTPSSAR
ncbi:MAG TPA: hypothetical protein VNK41_04085 [Vicinamibacterales bacterium]|nr:hypothetical protein [Vicinamibacterales bacterium]